jgi:hypothetical protein
MGDKHGTRDQQRQEDERLVRDPELDDFEHGLV